MKSILKLIILFIVASFWACNEAIVVPIEDEDISKIIVPINDKTIAFDTLGKIVWSSQNMGANRFMAPFIYKNAIYAAFVTDPRTLKGYVQHFDIKTGLAAAEPSTKIYGLPNLFYEDKVLLTDGSNLIRTYDLLTNTKIWSKGISTKYSLPVMQDGNVFFLDLLENILYCLDFKTGNKIWETPTDEKYPRSDAVCYPIVAGDKLIVPLEKKVVAYNIKTGVKIWEYKNSSAFNNKPLAYNDGLLAYSINKEIKVLETTTGTLKWSAIDKNNIVNPLRFYKNMLLINSEELQAFDKQNGTKLWSVKTTDHVSSYMVAGKGVLYINGTSTLNAYNTSNGSLKWKVAIDSKNMLNRMTLITNSNKAIY